MYYITSAGGRSTASRNVKQFVEVREEDTKFKRLLELLGEWYQKGSILIFCARQEDVDKLFAKLVEYSYPCLSLHGGMDQTGR